MAKVLLLSQDVVGKAMAGSAIRYWEMAKALSKSHQVTLCTPNQPDITSAAFKVVQRQESYQQLFKHCDIVISQVISLPIAWGANQAQSKLILDAYDPIPLEHLEIFKNEAQPLRELRNRAITDNMLFSLTHADGIICANAKQKDLWLGTLLGLHRLNPSVYDVDPSLRHLLEIVPFGMPEEAPKQTGPGLRAHFHLKASDKVILWGGGIWNWFDPLTVIKALHELAKERADIKLVFMGIKHPNEAVPNMKMTQDALELAKDLDLLDKHVFFNYGWTPYEHRQNFLLDADIGISTHFDHLETHYAFRTRMLDYIWSELPIVATEGDCFAELVKQHHLGIVVPNQDPKAVMEAIKQIIAHPELIATMKANLRALKPTFYWTQLMLPLNNMIDHLALTPSSKPSLAQKCRLLCSFAKHNRPRIILHKVQMKLKHKCDL